MAQKRKISDIVQQSVQGLTRRRSRSAMVNLWDEILQDLLNSGFADKTVKKAITDIRNGIKAKLDVSKPAQKQKYEWLNPLKSSHNDFQFHKKYIVENKTQH